MPNTCQTCQWFKPDGKRYQDKDPAVFLSEVLVVQAPAGTPGGRCVVDPPKVYGTTTNGRGKWPLVLATEVCGKFQQSFGPVVGV